MKPLFHKEGRVLKFLLWEIRIEPYRLAKLQWILFKLFGYKSQKYPCDHTKTEYGYFCHQPLDLKHCNIINDGEVHRVVCKCCGHSKIESNCYIDPSSDKEWINF